MEIRVNRVEFLKKLKVVEKAISENKIKPIISCAYIETSDKGLKFFGTNLEITIITEMACEIKERGKIVFQHQIVEEYLKELSDEIISLKADESILTIETEDSATEFSLFQAEEFPKSYLVNELGQGEPTFSVNSDELVEAFEKTKFSAAPSTDDMRINCVKVDAKDGKVNFVGTDTYRLVYLQKEFSYKNDFSISLPLNTVDVIAKLFRTLPNGEVSVVIGTKNVRFHIGEVIVISRVIDLPFPDYRGILGSLSYNKKLTINAGEFFNILKRVIIFVRSNNDSKFGALFSLEGDKFSIVGSNEVAKINEELQVNYSGDNIKISLNTKFLLDFISNLDQEKNVIVELTSSNGAIKVTEENNEKYIYIVMPLALRG